MPLVDESSAPRLVIVGHRGGTNIGESLERAAARLRVPCVLADAKRSMDGPAWLRRGRWHLGGRKPLRLESFSRDLLQQCARHRPEVLLVTGITPPGRDSLREIGSLGVVRISFLTDDPWNPAHRAPWYREALQEYDFVFSPRQANLEDLRRTTRANVEYLPFAYDPELFFPAPRPDRFACDVVFAGGGDPDRVPFMSALARQGHTVYLYGGYWERYPETRALARGMADVAQVREAVAAARVSLCLVRRLNRDGHSMRTFEVPAMRGCAVMEDTPEHRALFGPDGQNVLYFRTMEEMLERVAWVVSHPAERDRLADAAYRLITGGGNTYEDRLASILHRVGKGELLASRSAR